MTIRAIRALVFSATTRPRVKNLAARHRCPRGKIDVPSIGRKSLDARPVRARAPTRVEEDGAREAAFSLSQLLRYAMAIT